MLKPNQTKISVHVVKAKESVSNNCKFYTFAYIENYKAFAVQFCHIRGKPELRSLPIEKACYPEKLGGYIYMEYFVNCHNFRNHAGFHHLNSIIGLN